jgi:hypothetical protein
MPVLSRFGAQPDSVEDAEVLYRQAAQATIALVNENAAVATDVETVLAHLDNDVARTEDLLVDMLARRDQWLPALRHTDDRQALQAVWPRATIKTALLWSSAEPPRLDWVTTGETP